jgi:hypothetical protein
MPSKDTGEDIAFFLYLVPIFAAIIYGVYEWAITAHTTSMPSTAYLVVGKSPYLFLLSLVAVCAAIVVELNSAAPAERNGIIQSDTTRLQTLAIVVLIISLAAGISAGGYNLTTGVSFFINGRYALIFAFFLIGISILLQPKQVLGNLQVSSIPDVVGLVLLVAAPVLFYAGLKVHLSFTAAAIGALVVAIIGLALLLGGSNLFAKKEPKKAEAPHVSTA